MEGTYFNKFINFSLAITWFTDVLVQFFKEDEETKRVFKLIIDILYAFVP